MNFTNAGPRERDGKNIPQNQKQLMDQSNKRKEHTLKVFLFVGLKTGNERWFRIETKTPKNLQLQRASNIINHFFSNFILIFNM